jgi:hypothetical protein
MSDTPLTDKLAQEMSPVPIDECYSPMMGLAQELERKNTALTNALRLFANLDRSVCSDMWAIRPEYCAIARAALGET